MSDLIKLEKHDRVALVRLNRTDAMNALNAGLTAALGETLRNLDEDEGIGCIVLTGNQKAFAAGADIKELQDLTFAGLLKKDHIDENWEAAAHLSKPIIAAVDGYALGGGCELAMMCDFILATPKAKFGQPEIKLGTIPGAGGTQRLTRAVGKAKAMDMCLSGRMMDAQEAERAGLVARIVEEDKLIDESLAVAKTIAGYSLPVTKLCKQAVNRAFESTLEEGIAFERLSFHATFALEDRAEGMESFVQKKEPDFKHR